MRIHGVLTIIRPVIAAERPARNAVLAADAERCRADGRRTRSVSVIAKPLGDNGIGDACGLACLDHRRGRTSAPDNNNEETA